jgi:hypothetical protein
VCKPSAVESILTDTHRYNGVVELDPMAAAEKLAGELQPGSCGNRELADKYGLSESAISKLLSLNELFPEEKDLVRLKKLSRTSAYNKVRKRRKQNRA